VGEVTRRLPAGARRALGALALLTALFLLRFVLVRPLPGPLPSGECFTGAIAEEILAHGFRFPVTAYIPWAYENGILVEGVLSAAFFGVAGANLLALKLLPFAFFVVAAACGLALLRRLREAHGLADPAARGWSAVAFVSLLALAPSTVWMKSVDAVGDHNEGTALSLLLLVLLARRAESPSPGRMCALWALAGFFAWWQKATIVAALLSLVVEARAFLRRSQPPSWSLAALACALAAYAPGLWLSHAWGFGDLTQVLSLFGGEPGQGLGERLGAGAAWTWEFFDESVPRALLAGGALAWLAIRALRPPAAPPAARTLLRVLAAYVLVHGVLTLLATPSGPPRYHLYVYVPLVLPLALGAGAGAAWLGRRVGRWAAHLVPAAALGGAVSLGLASRWTVDFSHAARLAGDRDQAACAMRFGRAFLFANPGEPETALAWCRSLAGPRALECVSGMGDTRARDLTGCPPGDPRRPECAVRRGEEQSLHDGRERRAYAFGFGGALMSVAGGAPLCRTFPSDRERADCAAGLRWHCWAYLAAAVELHAPGRTLHAPACDVDPPYPGYQAAGVRAWRQGPGAGPGFAALLREPTCREALAACWREAP
jgi:hypothetical protein